MFYSKNSRNAPIWSVNRGTVAAVLMMADQKGKNMIKLALSLLLAVNSIHTEPAHVVDTYDTVVDCEIADGNVYSFYDSVPY